MVYRSVCFKSVTVTFLACLIVSLSRSVFAQDKVGLSLSTIVFLQGVSVVD